MNTKITSGRKSVFAALLALGLAAGAAGQQETFRVTQIVETEDGRTCMILSVSGRTAKVGCGEDGKDLRTYKFEQMKSQAAEYWRRDAERRKEQAAQDAAKEQERAEAVSVGDMVLTPDGRTGRFESFKDQDMAKVRFGTGSNNTQYFMVNVLKKAVDPSKEVLKVGDTVLSSNANGRVGRIESINGNVAKVRLGSGPYDFVNNTLSGLIGPRELEARQQNAEQEQIQKPMRAQFADEAEPFMKTVKIIANSYSSQFFDSGDAFTASAAERSAWLKDMEGLAVVCQKYPNITNGNPHSSESIEMHPADVCKIAEQRVAVVNKTRGKLGDLSATQEIASWSIKLNEATQSSEGLIEDDIQMMLYERSAWEQQNMKFLRKKYSDMGATMSPEVLKPLYDYTGAKKEMIETAGAARAWEQPHAADAAMEALARRRAAVDFPGSQVLKTGMTYATWKVEDTKSFVGSDSFWRYYKITPGAFRYKMGRALVKMPNRPMCQIREFQVTQPKAGGGFGAAKASFARAGIFVKCP